MKSRFTPQEIERIVHESREESVAAVAHKYGVTEQTMYNWRKRLGISSSGYMRIGELKRLQQENARLKRLVAERDLDIDMMKENAGKNVGSVAERQEKGSSSLWSEITRSAAFATFSNELSAENKS